MKESVVGTALAKELCIVCTKEIDGPILINTRLSAEEAKKIEKLHGQIIGFAEEPCQECKENINKAFMFIGFDEEKSDMENLPEGFYRTGQIVGTKKDIPLVQEWVKENVPNAIEKGYMFMPYQVMIHFGLIKQNIEE